MIYHWYAHSELWQFACCSFLTDQGITDELALHMNWLMVGCFGNWKFSNDIVCCLVAIRTLAAPLLYYCHNPTNGQYWDDINSTPARSVSCMIELAILTQHIATKRIFLNWCLHDQYRLMRVNNMYIFRIMHLDPKITPSLKKRYDNRGLPRQHHEPQARHPGIYIHILIRIEISHASMEEALKR